MVATNQNPLEAFIWGAGGSKKTPEEIARDKEIAADLLLKAGNTSPVQHWTQGAARVADALSGVIKQKRAERAGEENAAYNQGILSELFKGSAAQPAAQTSASIPASGASAEIAATSPAGAAVTPSFANDGTELGGYLSDPSLRAKLPAGMRNNNPGNIKFVGQKIPGIVGPSVNTDQGDPQAVFATPEAGMNAMFQLAKRKYDGGKKTADQLIAGNMGWTPGNHAAAANVAASMGLSPHDDINLNDPAMAAKFVRGLIIQEHGKSGALYPESMVMSAIGGQPVEVASAEPQTATDAIEQQAPMPVADQGLSGEVAAFRGTPEALAAFPGRQEAAMAAQQPTAVQQVAQALPAAGQAQQAVPGMSEALLRAISDPRATPQTRAVAQALMQQQAAQQAQAAEQQQWMARQQYEQAQRQNDPATQLDMQYKQAQLDALRGKPSEPAEVQTLRIRAQEAGLQPGTPEYQQFMTSGGKQADSITINNGEGNKFYNKLDEKNAETFSGLSDTGMQARSKLAQIDRLEGLMTNAPQGAVGALKQAAGEWGIATEGLSDIQAASALLEKMVPEQRAPGSGPMSDADIKMFRASLPRVINQPGGNQLVFQTMRGIAQYEMEMGAIADKVANRERKEDGTVYTPADARRDIASLKNPLLDFKIPDAKTSNQGTGVARPQTDDEFNALPSGAMFVDPDDGNIYRKP